MTKIRKEWLSALIDGEASEIEVHRLVREFRSDETLNSSWAVYQKIRATARTNTDRLSIEHHQRLFDRISAAVEGEDTHSGSLSASTGFSNTGFSNTLFKEGGIRQPCSRRLSGGCRVYRCIATRGGYTPGGFFTCRQ